jgi:DNA-binding response OmpR family regulator
MMDQAKRVLIVDDERDIVDGVSRWLSAAGYDTLIAGDGYEGVESATRNAPDAILLDVLMPNKDGMTTLAELRAQQQTNNIPVVMLSASLRDEQRALDAGARFFVHKPYDGRKLVSTIDAAVEENGRE